MLQRGETGRLPVRWPRVATSVVGVLACLIAFGEIDRLVGAARSADGASRTFGDLFGLDAFAGRSAWEVWATSSYLPIVVRLLVAHVAMDIVFVACLVAIARVSAGRGRFTRFLLVGFVVAEVIEDGLALLQVVLLEPGFRAGVLAAVIMWASVAKWVLAALLVLRVLGRSSMRRVLAQRFRLIARALFYQRLSLVVVLATAVLSVVPLADIWDQLPDVQRQWVDGTWRSGRHLLLAVVVSAAVTVHLFVLGRLRAARARRTYRTGVVRPDGPPSRGWLVGPVVVGVAALMLVVTGAGDQLDLAPFALFVGVLFVLWRVSWTLRWWYGPRWRLQPAPARDAPLARWVRIVGDALAVSVVVAAGLGLVRSFVAPVLLGPDSGTGWWRWSFQLALVILGIALAGFAVPGAHRVDRLITDRLRTGNGRDGMLLDLARLVHPDHEDPDRPLLTSVAPRVLLGSAAAWLGAVLLWPVWMSSAVGVVALVGATLGAWAVLFGYLVVHLQDRQPLEVFRAFGLRAAPVLTIFLLIPLVAAQRGGDEQLHALRPGTGSLVGVTRPDPATMVASWAALHPECGIVTPGGVVYRPAVLLAAAGGGIRAAIWTVGMVDALAGIGTCGQAATLLSSGVSGGSLGLLVSAADDPRAVVSALAGPDALGAAVAGLLVRDVVAGATGIRASALDEGAGQGWVDRAGLMERSWERTAPGLAASFGAGPTGPGGTLALNSTAAGPGCRVIISQVALPVEPRQPACAESLVAPATTDFVSSYAACSGVPRLSTVAMLSARFPFITPAGRIPPCGTSPARQLIDGGYAEVSGLGTLDDLATPLLAAMRDHNAAAAGTRASPFVVPIVLYLQDGPGGSAAGAQPPLTPELLVPLVGLGAAGVQLADTTWLERLSDTLADPCPTTGTGCRDAVGAVRADIAGGIVVARARSVPAVEAPLGWTLSEDSTARLRGAVAAQLAECATQRGRGEPACFADLLALLRTGG